jgi:predicted nucleotidyltransferase
LPIKPKQIFLFGSHARGNADQLSDFDLIIVYSTTKPFLDRLRELYTLWTIRKGVDILAYTPSEFREMKRYSFFIQEVIKEGILLYEAKS